MACDSCYPFDCHCGSADCGTDCIPSSALSIPGPTGEKGDTGAAGSDGLSAFTTVSVAGVMPAVSANVTLSTSTNPSAFSIGQAAYVQGSGYFVVVSFTTTSITLQNSGSVGNAAPATVIALNSKISSAGPVGVLVAPLPIASGGTGQATALAAFNALSPNTTQGDITFFSGGGNGRLAIGTANFILTSVGGIPAWALNAPAAANITGILAIASGGTAASTAAGARTSLAVPGTAVDNTYTGSNSYGISIPGKAFSITGPGGDIARFDPDIGISEIRDSSGTESVNAEDHALIGPWTQTLKSKAVANTSTFSAWTNIETVVSTYSLTGTQAITLPALTDDRICRIIDGVGGAATNPITISRAGGDTILGATTYVINNAFGGVTLRGLASTTNWIIEP